MFSASADYKSVSSGTTKDKKVIITSKAECSIYDGQLQTFALPFFSKGFLAGVDTLSATYDKESYSKFIEAFGTHYVSKIKMGARFGYYSIISENGWTTLTDKSLKVENAASLSGWGVSGSEHSMTDDEKKQAKEFDDSKESTKTFVLGSYPPSSGKSEDWAQQTLEDEPMPIKYTLNSLNDLFTSKNFKDQKNIDVIKSNIE